MVRVSGFSPTAGRNSHSYKGLTLLFITVLSITILLKRAAILLDTLWNLKKNV